MIRKILPAVKRGQRPPALGSKQRKVQIVGVEMQDVELVGALAHLVEHDHLVRNRIAHIRIEPQGASRAGHQFGGGD
jgi:hypothetical protein